LRYSVTRFIIAEDVSGKPDFAFSLRQRLGHRSKELLTSDQQTHAMTI
jgi:hypothetical protein